MQPAAFFTWITTDGARFAAAMMGHQCTTAMFSVEPDRGGDTLQCSAMVLGTPQEMLANSLEDDVDRTNHQMVVVAAGVEAFVDNVVEGFEALDQALGHDDPFGYSVLFERDKTIMTITLTAWEIATGRHVRQAGLATQDDMASFVAKLATLAD